MIKPSINEVLNKIDNRYYLVGTVGKKSERNNRWIYSIC